MLLSDPKVQELLRDKVIPVWESIRPVPKVTIDFGDGKVLQRTLKGNTVIYLSKPDGTVIDALPGVYTPADFLSQIEPALSFAASSGSESLTSWHRKQVGSAVEKESARVTLSKAIVESPLLNALGVSGRAFLPGEGSSRELSSDQMAQGFSKLAKRITDLSEEPGSVMAVSRKVAAEAGTNLTKDQVERQIVQIDSAQNVRYVRPAVHLLLASWKERPTPESLKQVLFKQLLQVPLDDPYLGLSELAIPGTPR